MRIQDPPSFVSLATSAIELGIWLLRAASHLSPGTHAGPSLLSLLSFMAHLLVVGMRLSHRLTCKLGTLKLTMHPWFCIVHFDRSPCHQTCGETSPAHALFWLPKGKPRNAPRASRWPRPKKSVLRNFWGKHVQWSGA